MNVEWRTYEEPRDVFDARGFIDEHDRARDGPTRQLEAVAHPTRHGCFISAAWRGTSERSKRTWSTMYTGLAWYVALAAVRDDRPEGQHCCSDLDYYRRLGVDVDGRPRRRRIAKLRAAIPASLSVFRELMRRPAGATIVILAPKAERPTAADDTVVFDERELRDAS